MLEIGTGWGYSARAFSESIGIGGEVVSIDCVRRITNDNLAAIAATGVHFTQIHGKSQVEFATGPFDILYIDGDPARAALDFARFAESVRDGGLIIMDGYGGQSGPTEAVDNLNVRHPFVTIPYNLVYSFAIHRKPLPIPQNGRHIAKCEECPQASFSETWSGIDEWADNHVATSNHAVALWAEPRHLKYRKKPC